MKTDKLEKVMKRKMLERQKTQQQVLNLMATIWGGSAEPKRKIHWFPSR